jgi:hypothetical protein
MDWTHKSSVLWGLVGALSFLVLLQGYHLVAGEFVGVSVMVGTAVVVFGLTAVSAQVLRPRIATRNERP